jgi:hypothetical protein
MILSADMSIMLDRILDAATDNLRFAKILVQMSLDPNNVTWDAIFNRLLERQKNTRKTAQTAFKFL